ncbi:MAG: hypothetical protein AAF203_11005 [Pseudomonadota bacterium]
MRMFSTPIALLSALFILSGPSLGVAEDNYPSITAYSLESILTANGDDVNSQSYAGIEMTMTPEFKVNLALRLEEIFDLADNDDFDWEEALAEINGTIRLDAFGQPVMIIAGKHLEVVMKKRLSAVDLSDRARLQPDEIEEVIGVIVDVTPEFLDSLQVAVTETQGQDFRISDDTIRMTVRAEKALNASVTLDGSLSYEANRMSPDGFAASFGVVIDTEQVTGIEGLSIYGQVTQYNDYAGESGNKTAFDGGVNYAIADDTDATLGLEVFDGDTQINTGVEHRFAPGWSVRGNVYADGGFDDFGGQIELRLDLY